MPTQLIELEKVQHKFNIPAKILSRSPFLPSPPSLSTESPISDTKTSSVFTSKQTQKEINGMDTPRYTPRSSDEIHRCERDSKGINN
jgi:hypothetical protein